MGSSTQDWLAEFEKNLKEKPKPDGYHDIHCLVPKSLKNANTEVFYIPQVISLGPYHFLPESTLREIEVLKVEAARKHNNLLKGGLESVVQNFKDDDIRKIRKIYGGLDVVVENRDNTQNSWELYGVGFPRNFRKDELLWMLVRDGCFLIEILNGISKNGASKGQKTQDHLAPVNEGSTTPEEKNGDNKGQEIQDLTASVIEGSTTPNIETLLKRRYHPLWNDIVKDMLKMENQVPMFVLDKIVQKRFLVKAALKKLSPILVNVEEDIENDNPHHLLQVLHSYMMDKEHNKENVAEENNKEKVVKEHTANEVRKEENVDEEDDKEHLRKKAVPRHNPVKKKIWKVIRYSVIILVTSPGWILLLAALVVIIFVLLPVLLLYVVWLVISVIWEVHEAGRGAGRNYHVRTLEELKRLGVKFKKLDGRGIYHIKFDERDSTLYLPKFEVDDRSEVILRNLMALEMSSDDDVEKPITRYAFLMNDLVNTSADVAILRKEIITSKLGSDEDVAKLWNSVVVATEMPDCKPIDEAASRINSYCMNRSKVLWAQFKMIHCSKPWLVLSLIGGISLLILTVVQVACLFRDCQIK